MAKRLLGSVKGNLKKRVTKMVLPVAAKLAEGAVAALDAADRLVEKKLSKSSKAPARSVKRDGAGTPMREGAAPKRETPAKREPKRELSEPQTKVRARPAVAAKRVMPTKQAAAKKKASAGFKVKRGQKHNHHR